MATLWATEKQQQVLWLRFIERKSINEIAALIGIQRRSVLARLRNARKRLKTTGSDPDQPEEFSAQREKRRMLSPSQVSSKADAGPSMEEL